MAEVKKAERPIFAAGIDGLQPGLATVLDDPRDWNKRDANGEYIVPNGSLIFVDEAWKWFGHLQDATRQQTPAHVLALAEHRHRGIDFVWTTQGPSQIYPFARTLIADHQHCVRRFGTHMIDVFKWEELQEDVKSPAKRENAQRTTRALPKAVFGSYKSADVHTIKRKIPLKVLALPLMVVAAVGLLYVAYNSLRPSAVAEKMAGKAPEAASADPAHPSTDSASSKGRRKGYASAEEYVAAHTPRIASLPWSAPLFDDRAPQSEPEIYCMASGIGLDADGNTRGESTFCVTEQGTRLGMDPRLARELARWGSPYNPYRAARESGRVEGSPSTETGRSAPAPSPGATMDAQQVSGYGDIASAKPEAAT